jgi:hypothetical protein
MKLLPALLAALVLAAPAAAGGFSVATFPALVDVSIPYWCDWGYDWDERCYRDDSDRVGVGGVGDKVWRAALRFALDTLPADATVTGAELWLWYDRTCVAPFRRTQACDGRGYELDAHPVYSERWQSERELEFGPIASAAELALLAEPGWMIWDLTELVEQWRSGEAPNRGVLLKLADGQEDYDSSGPAFPSSSYADPERRPRLVVTYYGP